jgi:Domain of unknown function (DUF4399)
MRLLISAIAVTLLVASAVPVSAGTTKRDPAAELYIGWPNNGEVIKKRTIRVWFGLRNMGVAPAGVDTANTGHHHLIIDAELPAFDEPIPNDEHHLHFGKGQTETVIELPPGQHTLQLIMGDKDHVPLDPPLYSKKITITVK